MFSLGIESFDVNVEEVTTFDVMLLSLFVISPPPAATAAAAAIFLLLLETLDELADFPNDGEFRTTDAGFGLTTQFPLDVA